MVVGDAGEAVAHRQGELHGFGRDAEGGVLRIRTVKLGMFPIDSLN
jgi:hypothetical protein